MRQSSHSLSLVTMIYALEQVKLIFSKKRFKLIVYCNTTSALALTALKKQSRREIEHPDLFIQKINEATLERVHT